MKGERMLKERETEVEYFYEFQCYRRKTEKCESE